MTNLQRSLPLLICAALTSAAQPSRPAITGISHMCVYSADAKASDDFYARILGGVKAPDLLDANGSRYYFSPPSS